MAALVVVLLLGRFRGRLVPSRLLLAGVAIGYMLSAVTSFLQLKLTDGNGLAGVVFWLLGTLASASWRDLTVPALAMGLSTVWLLFQARGLNALLAGEETASSLGVDVARLRLKLLVMTAILTGTSVAVAGGIGFVGLMVPHMGRLLVGSDHRRLLPVTVLIGAIFLVLVDVIARWALRPMELPLSVITAMIGAPFFLWLMRRSGPGGVEGRS